MPTNFIYDGTAIFGLKTDLVPVPIGSGLTLAHYAAGSSAGNKFLLPNSTNVVIPPYGTAQIIYDANNGAYLLSAKGF